MRQVISIKEFLSRKMTGIVKTFDGKAARVLSPHPMVVSMSSFMFQRSISAMQKKLPPDYAWNFAG